MDELLHGDEQALYGDRAYINEAKQKAYEAQGRRWRVQRRGRRQAPLSARDRQWNRRQSKVRAKVEHIFHVIKRLWGHHKVRYRGLAKNEAHCFSLLALANLYLVRRDLLLLVSKSKRGKRRLTHSSVLLWLSYRHFNLVTC